LEEMFREKLYIGVLGAVLFACCLGIGMIALARSERAVSTSLYPTAIVEVIPAPTLTPSLQPTASPVPADGITQSPNGDLSAGLIRLGDSVQIYGTQGDGLRLRAKPGLEGEILFLAYEGEIFVVKDGPQEASGYIWWYLVAPYDENVKGWAVENFLKALESQN
jgi:hypothetical protein